MGWIKCINDEKLQLCSLQAPKPWPGSQQKGEKSIPEAAQSAGFEG